MDSDALEGTFMFVDNGWNGIPLNPLISYSSHIEKANQRQTQHSNPSATDHCFLEERAIHFTFKWQTQPI